MIPLRDNIPSKTFPFVTILFILINSALFIYEFSLGSRINQFLLSHGCIPYEIIRGRGIVTLISSMFLHGSWLHLIGNMLFLYIFGDNVEDWLGHFRFLLFYIGWGLAAAILQILISPNSKIPFIGASGAIAGVMGGYFILYPKAKIQTLVILFIFVRIIVVPAFFFLGFWILLQILYGMFLSYGSNIAFFAHIGGFFAGIFSIRWMKRRKLLGWRI